jgi:hypothetical protein
MTSLKAVLIGFAMAGAAVPALAQDTTTTVTTHTVTTRTTGPAAAAGAGPGTVMVSCYRGPWRETLWDRPEAVFLDSLVALGYDYTAAEAIGERVCKDETLVDDPAALQAAVERILAASPANP